MESVCGDFLLILKCFLWILSMTGWQIYDWWTHGHWQGYTSTSGLQLCEQHLRDRSETYKQGKILGVEQLLRKQHDLSTLWSTHSQSSLQMKSSSWHLTQRTDDISPNRHQRLQATSKLCVWTEVLGSDTSHRQDQVSRAQGVMRIWKTGQLITNDCVLCVQKNHKVHKTWWHDRTRLPSG